MGSLAARYYPTKLFLNAADHTYVECGSGQVGWSCWGGKSNGALLRRALGSTQRADTIAETDERAGIACYLVNGVCHQSANRILLPTDETVDGARGYDLSVGLFGVYGRLTAPFDLCKAPLRKHENVNGDLPECLAVQQHDMQNEDEKADSAKLLDFMDKPYMAAVMTSYDEFLANGATDKSSLFDFQIEQFKLFVSHKFPRSRRIPAERFHRLLVAREDFERERLEAETELAKTDDGLAFVEKFDRLTIKFQCEVAHVLNENQYRALLDLSPDERIVVSDPDIVKALYEPPTNPRGMAP